MKPFCSGNRNDVEILQKLQVGELTDAEMNPYFYPDPVAPFVAAKKAKKEIHLQEVVEKISVINKRCDILLIEGAGGVMVPLGENFFIKDLIIALEPKIILVGRNQIGTINHTLLSLLALKKFDCHEIKVVLMGQKKEDISSHTNAETLQSFLRPQSVFELPFLGRDPLLFPSFETNIKKIKKILAALT